MPSKRQANSTSETQRSKGSRTMTALNVLATSQEKTYADPSALEETKAKLPTWWSRTLEMILAPSARTSAHGAAQPARCSRASRSSTFSTLDTLQAFGEELPQSSAGTSRLNSDPPHLMISGKEEKGRRHMTIEEDSQTGLGGSLAQTPRSLACGRARTQRHQATPLRPSINRGPGRPRQRHPRPTASAQSPSGLRSRASRTPRSQQRPP